MSQVKLGIPISKARAESGSCQAGHGHTFREDLARAKGKYLGLNAALEAPMRLFTALSHRSFSHPSGIQGHPAAGSRSPWGQEESLAEHSGCSQPWGRRTLLQLGHLETPQLAYSLRSVLSNLTKSGWPTLRSNLTRSSKWSWEQPHQARRTPRYPYALTHNVPMWQNQAKAPAYSLLTTLLYHQKTLSKETPHHRGTINLQPSSGRSIYEPASQLSW